MSKCISHQLRDHASYVYKIILGPRQSLIIYLLGFKLIEKKTINHNKKNRVPICNLFLAELATHNHSIINLPYTFGPILWYYLLSFPCASSLIYNIWKVTKLTLCHVFQDGHHQDNRICGVVAISLCWLIPTSRWLNFLLIVHISIGPPFFFFH